MERMNIEIILRKRLKPSFFIHDWHLAMTTKFMDADACKTICIGWVMIQLWTNKGWLK